jgi:predicted GNAT superfamily acetyltransferase
VGFCWGFLAFGKDGKTLKHASHQVGILPAFQGQGIGEQLKWKQREAVLAMDVQHITWTFDPLWTLNGRLNLRKLGGVCNTYQRNLYGNFDGGLNKGLPTDRFYVDWWLASEQVKARVGQFFPHLSLTEWRQIGATVVNPASMPNDPHASATLEMRGNVPALLIAVPKNYPALVQSDIKMALAWRFFTRELFEWAFIRGYQATDLVCGEKMCYYVLVADENKDG